MKYPILKRISIQTLLYTISNPITYDTMSHPESNPVCPFSDLVSYIASVNKKISQISNENSGICNIRPLAAYETSRTIENFVFEGLSLSWGAGYSQKIQTNSISENMSIVGGNKFFAGCRMSDYGRALNASNES